MRNATHLGLLGLIALAFWVLAGPGCRVKSKSGTDRSDRSAGEDLPVLFEEIQGQVGLDFKHDPGKPGTWYYPEIMIAGAALLDYDCDDDLDIYLLNCGTPIIAGRPRDPARAKNRLFEQKADGRFVDVTEQSGLGDTGYGMGVAVGDVNNDGFPDVYITNVGQDRLFLNGGDGHFQDVTLAAGVSNERWSAAACFVDFDRDGWLDLYVSNYVDYFPSRKCYGPSGRQDYCGPASFDKTADRLFRNVTGDLQATDSSAASTRPASTRPASARFEDVSLSSGIAQRKGSGLGVTALDFNNDGWQDIYVANDMVANFLWINQRDGTFLDEALTRGVAYDALGRPQASMGIAATDLNGDQVPDLYITHMAGEMNVLYMSDGLLGYREVAMKHGLSGQMHSLTTFGTVFMDIDHDGDDDVVAVNGSMKLPDTAASIPSFSDPEAFWKIFSERNHVFINDGQLAFSMYESRNELLTTRHEVSRALCAGDIDNDGDLDLLIVNTAGPARLYRNVARKTGNWLRVRVVEPDLGGRDAYGARITVVGPSRRWTRWINPGASYLSSNEPTAHFGVGPINEVETIEVRWPDGSEEVFPGGPVNRRVVLRHGASAHGPGTESPGSR